MLAMCEANDLSAVFIQRQKQKTKKFFFNTRLVRIFIFIFEIRTFIVVGAKKKLAFSISKS